MLLQTLCRRGFRQSTQPRCLASARLLISSKPSGPPGPVAAKPPLASSDSERPAASSPSSSPPSSTDSTPQIPTQPSNGEKPARGDDSFVTVDTRGLYEGRRKKEITKPPLTPLGALLKSSIKQVGPISLADFMDVCLAHPEYGYYMQRESAKIGKAGDFITAPEISQMFGELLGVWLIATWEKLGMPKGVRIVEVGPGKGTLMKDLLRAARTFKPFMSALSGVHMVETSEVLRGVQAKTLADLSDVQVAWHDQVTEVPGDGPMLLVAQELLDALPVHQFELTEEGWRERMVVLDEDPASPLHFKLVVSPEPTRAVEEMQKVVNLDLEAKVGAGMEVCPLGLQMVEEVTRRVAATGGAAIFIDYGEDKPQADSLRGLRMHMMVHPMMDPGDVDLSTDVDFSAMRGVVEKVEGARAFGPMPQGQFLSAMGIEVRLEALLNAESVTEKQAMALYDAYRRLTDPEQMGRKYKAWAVVSGKHQGPATAFGSR